MDFYIASGHNVSAEGIDMAEAIGNLLIEYGSEYFDIIIDDGW